MSGDSIKKVVKKAAKVTMIGALTDPLLKKGKEEFVKAITPDAQAAPAVEAAKEEAIQKVAGIDEKEMAQVSEEGSGELVKKKRKTSSVLTSPLGTAMPSGKRPTLGG